ncbi:MAG: 50S ribosomal protein L29 [Phycisphaerales bacterium]|nr:MAG: 50S ribosomal protein L29 [Phycisphaerales bacterium]
MKISDLRTMKTEELYAELEQMRRHLFDLRSQAVTEKLENPQQLKSAQKDIARILTVLIERGERTIEQKQAHLESTSRKVRR